MQGKWKDWGQFSLQTWITPTLKKDALHEEFELPLLKWFFFLTLYIIIKVLNPFHFSLGQSPEFSLLFISCLKLETFSPYCLSKYDHFLCCIFFIILWEPIRIASYWTNNINICGTACFLPINNKGDRVCAHTCTHTPTNYGEQSKRGKVNYWVGLIWMTSWRIWILSIVLKEITKLLKGLITQKNFFNSPKIQLQHPTHYPCDEEIDVWTD